MPLPISLRPGLPRPPRPRQSRGWGHGSPKPLALGRTPSWARRSATRPPLCETAVSKGRRLQGPRGAVQGCWLSLSRSAVSDSLPPYGLQRAGPPHPSPSAGARSDSRPSSWWLDNILEHFSGSEAPTQVDSGNFRAQDPCDHITTQSEESHRPCSPHPNFKNFSPQNIGEFQFFLFKVSVFCILTRKPLPS